MKSFQDFIDTCCEQLGRPDDDVQRLLKAHMVLAGITERDVIVYINYPAYTEAALAAALDISESAVARTLARVRRAWPSLQGDPSIPQHGGPSLPKMQRYEPYMDIDVVERF